MIFVYVALCLYCIWGIIDIEIIGIRTEKWFKFYKEQYMISQTKL